MAELEKFVPQQSEALRASIEELLAEPACYVAALAHSYDLIGRLLALDEECGGEPDDIPVDGPRRNA